MIKIQQGAKDKLIEGEYYLLSDLEEVFGVDKEKADKIRSFIMREFWRGTFNIYSYPFINQELSPEPILFTRESFRSLLLPDGMNTNSSVKTKTSWQLNSDSSYARENSRAVNKLLKMKTEEDLKKTKEEKNEQETVAARFPSIMKKLNEEKAMDLVLLDHKPEVYKLLLSKEWKFYEDILLNAEKDREVKGFFKALYLPFLAVRLDDLRVVNTSLSHDLKAPLPKVDHINSDKKLRNEKMYQDYKERKNDSPSKTDQFIFPQLAKEHGIKSSNTVSRIISDLKQKEKSRYF